MNIDYFLLLRLHRQNFNFTVMKNIQKREAALYLYATKMPKKNLYLIREIILLLIFQEKVRATRYTLSLLLGITQYYILQYQLMTKTKEAYIAREDMVYIS